MDKVSPVVTAAPRSAVYVSFVAAINDQSVTTLIRTMSELVNQGASEIHLLFSSGGGSVGLGFALYNTLNALPIKLVTYNVGNVDSIANVVFLSGEERYAASSATFMFHGVTWGAPNPITGQQAREAVANIGADEARIAAVIAERTNLPQSDVELFFREAATKDAQYALEHGFIQEIRNAAIPSGAPIVALTY